MQMAYTAQNSDNDARRGARLVRAHISVVDRLIYFLRSRGAQVVVLALVANTMVAQLLYKSPTLWLSALLGGLLDGGLCAL
jgi:hypothetical protein